MRLILGFLAVMAFTAALAVKAKPAESPCFAGKHFSGCGNVEYLRLLDTARRMFEPDPEFQNLSMLYTPEWNGLVEGPTWNAWWIQNSYGTTYAALPFLREPFLTFLQNSQDLWFDQMGNGQRHGCPSGPEHDWVAPDGQLCDCASPGCIIYKQGDGRTGIHDWGLEFTAAGIVLQAELLLISRNPKAVTHYLPLLERSANFLDTRRDPKSNLFLAGPAANLLAPSYAGWHRPDGTYGKAYLSGLSITYIAALDRLIELEKLAGASAKVKLYTKRRDLARKGLPLLTTRDSYFIKSLDPDGTRHGVYGAAHYGYFASTPNIDAICFRVVDHAQAEKIYAKIASIPGLRPYNFIIANYPSLDDMYEQPKGLWRFGEWVNGGAWSTCEARAIMAYYRLGKYEDARRSMEKLLSFARRFRMDNPLTDFGNALYQPKKPINLTYDAFGPAAAFIRGLFEYQYDAEGLRLIPHIPPGVSELEQLDPIRFGQKRLYLLTAGRGEITSVTINGRAWKSFDGRSIFLPYEKTPEIARIDISLGGGTVKTIPFARTKNAHKETSNQKEPPWLAALDAQAERLSAFHKKLQASGFGKTYEAAHAQLAVEAVQVIHERRQMQIRGKIKLLPTVSEAAADQSYRDTATKLIEGLKAAIKVDERSADSHCKRIFRLYVESR
jgi:tetratricopeptide (TPR) repeat protein